MLRHSAKHFFFEVVVLGERGITPVLVLVRQVL